MSSTETCCGTIRTTPFCPQCGSAMQQHPLTSLLVHVRNSKESVTRQCKSVERFLSQIDSDDRRHDKFQQKIENAQKRTAKWTRWEESLVEVITEAHKG